ncbi:unnamed protein product [Scytosiphon promiscuus]
MMATLRKLDGRDKFTKIIQYGARFFVWWFAATDPALSQRAFKLYRTTQQSRKAFRLLKVLDEVVKLRQILLAAASASGSSSGAGAEASGAGALVLGYTESLMSARCLAMGAFWMFDNLNYLTVTETVNFGVARATRGFSRAWSVSSALFILLGIDSLRKTKRKRQEALAEYAAAVKQSGGGDGYGELQRQERPEREGGEGDEEAHRRTRLREAVRRANAEHFKSWLMILKGALDLTCAVNVAGMDLPKRFLGRKLNDGVIGAAGCASALCVLYSSWPARKQEQKQQQQQQQSLQSQQLLELQNSRQQPLQDSQQLRPRHQQEHHQPRHGRGVAA